MSSPNIQPVFSHQTEDEPVDYPAPAATSQERDKADQDLNAPFSAPESTNR
ncbi:hypothetical protein LWP59_07980 [Amycolatopsis acidiphila]|uniref:hypothetical protein n=1 Tax=Amycolatopsis acidiphila TaxID=715473 RepID=UPI001643DADB|nr:hypothetical protein [Amycolatopsis acidiphila]UIJ61553.1 hypothetical protein LWP59_07980 [Amycolatopsis acidiphila]GHG59271.1 hypothetical protein GCM10017788_12560 [Amycolatopsis acidiphila]